MHHPRSRTHRPAGNRVGLIAGSLLLAGVTFTPVTAQEGLPLVPGPDQCVVTPREAPVWDRVELPEPTAPVSISGPFVPPTGAPADGATRTAVTATITRSIACQNAGDIGRMLALFSDDGVRSFFSGPRGYDAEAVDALIDAGPNPVADDRLVELVAVGSVVTIEDGRVAATVTTSASGIEYLDVVYLSAAPDGAEVAWLIDDSVAIGPQTRVEGGATEIP